MDGGRLATLSSMTPSGATTSSWRRWWLYITDYCIVYTGRRVAGLIKQYSLSSNTKVLVGQANSS
jgi:hypothetical protein